MGYFDWICGLKGFAVLVVGVSVFIGSQDFVVKDLVEPLLEQYLGYVKYLPLEGVEGIPAWAKVDTELQFHTVHFDDIKDIGLDEEVPTLIKHSPVADWEALKLWNPAYVIEAQPKLTNAKFPVLKKSVLLYEDDSRLFREWDDSLKAEYQKEVDALKLEHTKEIDVQGMGTLTVSQLDTTKIPPFKGIGDKTVGTFNITADEFFAMDVKAQWDTRLPSHFSDQVLPRNFMYVVDSENEPLESDFQENIRISKLGSTTGLHYDPSHNMFAQIHGCKRFVLIETKHWKKIKLHPFYHPSDRQSQLELFDFKSGSYRKPLPAMVIDLRPGDLLHLPPYYFHRVTAMECENATVSISVNVFSNSKAGRLSTAVKHTDNIPAYFVHPSSVEEKKQKLLVGALGYYVRTLVHSLTNSTMKEFVLKSIIQERYLTQDQLSEALECDGFNVTLCPSLMMNSEEFIKADPSFTEQVKADAEKKVETIKQAELSPSIQELVLADTIERVVTLVVSLERSCMFLQCLGNSI